MTPAAAPGSVSHDRAQFIPPHESDKICIFATVLNVIGYLPGLLICIYMQAGDRANLGLMAGSYASTQCLPEANTMAKLSYLELTGGPKEMGHALGRFGAHTLHTQLLPSPAWEVLIQWKNTHKVAGLLGCIEHAFPLVWSELQGLAAGLELPLDEVVLWNALPELLGEPCVERPSACRHKEAVMLSYPLDKPPHPELPWAVAKCVPTSGSAFMALIQPGFLPGSALSLNQFGLLTAAQASDVAALPGAVPAFVVLRALLDQVDSASARALLHSHKASAGMCLSMIHRQDGQLWQGDLNGLHNVTDQLAQQTGVPAEHDWSVIAHATKNRVEARISTAAVDWQVYEAGESLASYVFRDLTRAEG